MTYFFAPLLVCMLVACIYAASEFENPIDRDDSMISQTEKLQIYRQKYQSYLKILVSKVNRGIKVTPEENSVLHKYKKLAREAALKLERERAVFHIEELCNSSKYNKNIARYMDQFSWGFTSIAWTEVIDSRVLQVAVLSFRLIPGRLSHLVGAWMWEALSKAGFPSYREDSKSFSCRTTFLLAATAGFAIDNQHASASYAMAGQADNFFLFYLDGCMIYQPHTTHLFILALLQIEFNHSSFNYIRITSKI